ncbi:MAG: hypothetical protein ACK401_01020 [Archaeoglobaceae archaeon]
MKPLSIFLLLSLVTISNACVVELRSTTFYTNGTQDVTRDWFIVDFENKYGYTLFDVYFGDLAFVPIVRDGERIRLDPYKNVSPRAFPISVFATVESFADRSIARYVIQNFGEEVDVSISIPNFPDLISCDKCEVLNGSIVFNTTIAKNESASFNLTLKRDFVIPDGNISFVYREEIGVSFTANVPVIIEKGRGERWIGVFNVSNILDKKIKGNVTAFVEINSNRTTLFHEEIELGPGESFSKSEEIESSSAPIFYLKAQLRAEDFCNLTILPASELDGRYLVGQATLKGFAHRSSAVVPGIGEIETLPTPEIVVRPTPEIPRTPETRVEMIELVLEITTPPPRVVKEIVVQYAIMMIPAIFGTFFTTLFVPIRSRGIVAIKEHERALLVIYPKFRIFTTPSNPVRGGIVIEPDEELVFRLLGMGLERKYAELIGVAVRVKKPAIVGDTNVARVAMSLGISVILYGRS